MTPITFIIAGIALCFCFSGAAVFTISKLTPWEWYIDVFLSAMAEKLLLIGTFLFCIAGISLMVSVLLTGSVV